jgi:hypothetical protein
MPCFMVIITFFTLFLVCSYKTNLNIRPESEVCDSELDVSCAGKTHALWNTWTAHCGLETTRTSRCLQQRKPQSKQSVLYSLYRCYSSQCSKQALVIDVAVCLSTHYTQLLHRSYWHVQQNISTTRNISSQLTSGPSQYTSTSSAWCGSPSISGWNAGGSIGSVFTFLHWL